MLRRTFLFLGPSLLLPSRGFAQSSAPPSEVERIADALRPRRRRGGSGPAIDPKALEVIERLKAVRRTRGMNHRERDELYTASKDIPQVDLEIYFDFNSAVIAAAARPKLDDLGQVLAREEFKSGTIVIGGHTDRKGTAAYNQPLSEKRAEAVGRYLAEVHKIDPTRLFPTGYGFSKLKLPAKPFADANRRVQIVNAAKG